MLVLPALAGLAFLVVPLAGLVIEAPWGTLLDRLAEPAVFQALRLSLIAASAATVVCLVCGVPLAWLLARSVVIPIALVELLFPRQGRQPYLRTAGVIITGVVTLLGAGLLRVSVPPSEEPGYVIPLPAAITVVVLIAALSVVALRLLPRRAGRGPAPVAPPSPAAAGLVCGATVLAFMALLFPFGGAQQPAFTHGMWVLVPMAVAAVLAVVVGLRLVRWSAASTWTDRHRLATIGAAVIAHTVFGTVAATHTIPDKVMMSALVIVMTVLLDRRLHAQSTPFVDTTTTS